jgi:hypothetical protein
LIAAAPAPSAKSIARAVNAEFGRIRTGCSDRLKPIGELNRLIEEVEVIVNSRAVNERSLPIA